MYKYNSFKLRKSWILIIFVLVFSFGAITSANLITGPIIAEGDITSGDAANMLDLKINNKYQTTLTGKAPYTAQFDVNVDWAKVDNLVQSIVPDNRGYYVKIYFGDGDDLNPDNCGKIDDNWQYKSLVCEQPLVGFTLSRGENSKTVIHTYPYNATFEINMGVVTREPVFRKECKMQTFTNYETGEKTRREVCKNVRVRMDEVFREIPSLTRYIDVKIPDVQLIASPLEGPPSSKRNLRISCPALFEFEYMQISGDKDSVVDQDLLLRGDKYFYNGSGTTAGDTLDVTLIPATNTTLNVVCRPVGLTDDIFNKYVKYQNQKYLNYQIPDTPRINKQITFKVVSNPTCDPVPTYCEYRLSGEEYSASEPGIVMPNGQCKVERELCPNGCNESTGLCNEEPPICLPSAWQCSGSLLVKDTGVYQNGVCQRESIYCANGCDSNTNECNPVDTCIEETYCAGNTKLERKLVNNKCETIVVGTCSPKPEIVSALKTQPKIVRKGGKSTISWSMKNVSSCTVIGTNGDSWTDKEGAMLSGEIGKETVYTLNCKDLDNVDIDPQEVRVYVAPTWQEI